MICVEKDYKGYDFYLGTSVVTNEKLFNIVPAGNPAPSTGYLARNYIERVKGVNFPDRYQPTLHGMSELYPNA